eukprot:3827301-Rhodomonas_salina.5
MCGTDIAYGVPVHGIRVQDGRPRLLRRVSPYPMPRTDIAYGDLAGITLPYHLCGTDIAYALAFPVLTQRMRSPFRYRHSVCARFFGTDIAYAVAFGTEIAYALGTEIAYGASENHCCLHYQAAAMVPPPISLRLCYAMSGTDVASNAIAQRSCYAMSGTDIAYRAMSGTAAIACRAGCSLLTQRITMPADSCPALTQFFFPLFLHLEQRR